MANVDCTEKTCSKCSVTKPVDSFHVRSDRPGNRQSACRDCVSRRFRESGYYERNRDRMIAYASARYARDPQVKEKAYAYKRSERGKAVRLKRESKPSEMLAKRIRSQLLRAIRGAKSRSPSSSIVGWSIDELEAHLEKQFVKGMNWGNMGSWHIDHIVPLSSFSISGIDDPNLKRAWSLSNLRPIWASENMSKGARRTHLL